MGRASAEAQRWAEAGAEGKPTRLANKRWLELGSRSEWGQFMHHQLSEGLYDLFQMYSIAVKSLELLCVKKASSMLFGPKLGAH